LRTVLASNGVALDGPLEVAFAPVGGLRDLPIMDNDVFLTQLPQLAPSPV
jgi:hypothetical protein